MRSHCAIIGNIALGQAVRAQAAVRQADPRTRMGGRPRAWEHPARAARRDMGFNQAELVVQKETEIDLEGFILNQANLAEKRRLASRFSQSGWHLYLHCDVNWELQQICLPWP